MEKQKEYRPESPGNTSDKKNGVREYFLNLADVAQFIFRFFRQVFRPPFESREIIQQSFSIGYKSIVPVSLTALIMGVVIVLQSRPWLIAFGAGSFIPSLSAVSIIKEVGPLITALVCAGNIGSSICAELGSMKVTEQIDAMEVSSTNPFKFLVVTRVLGCVFIIPILVVYADVVSMIGAFLGANIKGDQSWVSFFNQVFETLTIPHVVPSIIKSVLFGFAIGIISCHKGYTATNGTAGVGKATNLAVVTSLLMVIIIDVVIVQLANIFNYL